MFGPIRSLLSAAALALLCGTSVAVAQDVDALATATPLATATKPVLRSWMSPEVAAAWAKGYKGRGVTVTVVDDFNSTSKYSGNFGTGTQYLRHGDWTKLEISLLAPEATIRAKSFYTGTTVPLASGLNVLNLSYGMYASSSYSLSQLGWSAQESSIISYAKNGKAVVAKAAGNDAVAVGTSAGGQTDFLDLALVGAQSAIFAGALSSNGTTSNPATLASYSNYAGSDPTVQSHFLVVGVEGNKTGLYGTSFAAPIISGYAAILGSKFKTASSTQITNQLLTTARKDTLLNYDASIYGQGEASLTRALAPLSIK